MKLFCYPWSGGSSALYFKYSKILGNDITIIPSDVDCSKGTAFLEVIQNSAEKIVQQVQENEKFILFGHSMGAVIAYEINKALNGKIDLKNVGLVISGMLPPSRDMFEKLDSELTCEKAKNYSSELGMDNLDKLPDTFLDAVINKMNADNKFLKGYESCGDIKLEGPSAVIYSEQELALGHPSAWKELLSDDLEYVTVKGRHFYLTEDFSAVSKVINNIRLRLEKN